MHSLSSNARLFLLVYVFFIQHLLSHPFYFSKISYVSIANYFPIQLYWRCIYSCFYNNYLNVFNASKIPISVFSCVCKYDNISPLYLSFRWSYSACLIFYLLYFNIPLYLRDLFHLNSELHSSSEDPLAFVIMITLILSLY